MFYFGPDTAPNARSERLREDSDNWYKMLAEMRAKREKQEANRAKSMGLKKKKGRQLYV